VIAITFGTINIVGGFFVTDRMLEMFKTKPKPPAKDAERDADEDRGGEGKGEGP
jgi:NAD(P) transhydrogenase subunit alpha